MATYDGISPIVTDGLIFLMDAGNRKCWKPTTSNSGSCSSIPFQDTGSLINDVSSSLGPQGSWVFDGTDDYIELETTSFLRPSETELDARGFTINAWVNSNTTSQYQGIFCNDGAMNSTYWGLETGINSSGFFNMAKMDGGGAGFGDRRTATSDANIYPLGTWVYVTFNFVTSEDFDWKLYRNGVEASLVLNGGGGAVNYSSLKGAIGIMSFKLFDGEISIVQVYNRSLSQTEVLQNFNSQRLRFGV